ncbi:MAG: hypothetical protein AAGH78_01325 [Cyanobacteria bacterium P01_H01_bin.58]
MSIASPIVKIYRRENNCLLTGLQRTTKRHPVLDSQHTEGIIDAKGLLTAEAILYFS